jgi:hypothetical protein
MFLAVIVAIAFGFVLRLFSSYAFILYLGGCRFPTKTESSEIEKLMLERCAAESEFEFMCLRSVINFFHSPCVASF